MLVIKYCDFVTSLFKEGNNPDRTHSPHLVPEVCIRGAVTRANNNIFGLGRMLYLIYHLTKINSILSVGDRCLSYEPERRGMAADAYVDIQ